MSSSLQQVSRGVLEQLSYSANDVWGDRPRGIPPWVPSVVNEASVLRVLDLARSTTVELGVPSNFLNETSPSELATYWSIVFRDLSDQEIPRFPVRPDDVELTIAKRVASAVYSMHQQSTRYKNFLRFGPPPGVRQFPEFSGSERSKTLAVPWEWRRNAAQTDRTSQYRSCTDAKPRRVQSLRSQQCAPSDVLNPSLFV